MEIVAILSTIILIITSLTTVLAVFAYLLYKIRERKARSYTVAPVRSMQPQPKGTLTPTPGPHANQANHANHANHTNHANAEVDVVLTSPRPAQTPVAP